MTLDEAVLALERADSVKSVKAGSPMAFCQTGSEYIAIYSGGAAVNHRRPIWAATESLAISLWLDAAMKYASYQSGTLYWRLKPELNSITIDDRSLGIPHEATTLYSVRSRFVIDDRAEVERAA